MSTPLSAQERDRFATWLEREAHTDKMLAEQLEKLPSRPEPMAKKYRVEGMAAQVIAQKLRSISDETL